MPAHVLKTFLSIAIVWLCVQASGNIRAADPSLADQLRELDTNVFSSDERKEKRLGEMLSLDVRARRTAANQRESVEWRKIETREQWEKYRDTRIAALRQSLGTFPSPSQSLNVRSVRQIDANEVVIENIVFESRSGLWVTANLYRPSTLPPLARGGKGGVARQFLLALISVVFTACI